MKCACSRFARACMLCGQRINQGFTRVYLLAGLQVSRALPKFIVDYAAERAMPRATKWLRPEVEALQEEWLNNDLP